MPPRETLNLGGWETQPSSCLGPRSPSPPSTHLRPGLRSQAAPALPDCKPSPPRGRDKQLRPRRGYAARNSRPHRPGPREKAHKLDRAEAEPPARHVTATSLLPLTQRELRDAPSESLGRQGVGAREPHQFTTRAANSRALASHDQHSHSAHRLALPSPAKKMPSHLAPDSCTPPQGTMARETRHPRPFALQWQKMPLIFFEASSMFFWNQATRTLDTDCWTE